MNDENIKLQVGVIIIGSLLWDDDLKTADNLRKNWRAQSLDTQNKILVKLPIRYGRYSRGGIYTMVFSTNCEKTNRLGSGYIIPLKQNPIKHVDILISEARKMSEAEGMKNKFIGGDKEIWGSMAILINKKKVINKLTEKIIRRWTVVLKADGGGKDNSDYRVIGEKLSITKNGELQIDWPRAVRSYENALIDKYDILLSTSIKPKHQTHGCNRYPSIKEISNSVKNDNTRYYFLNNFICNITTFQDSNILNLI